MTNYDKIVAIVNRVSLFGSTHIYPRFGSFVMAFDKSNYYSNNLYLYDITSNDLVFCSVNNNRSELGELYPNYQDMHCMPLHWFDDKFLYGVLVTLKAGCREYLNENAYKEVMFEIGE